MDYKESHLTIQQWADEDRPREKLLSKGTSALSDAELIAILIRSGTPNVSAVEMAKQLLADHNNNLNELARTSPHEMLKRKGMGAAKGLSIIAALELGRRRQQQNKLEKPLMRNSSQSHQFLAPIVADLPHEEFHVLFLNRACALIAHERISIGGITGTVADVRVILKYALLHSAGAIILCHNHPSGNLMPSADDDKLTRRITDACKLMEIMMVDHIIVTHNGFYSYADEGKL